MPEFFFVHPTKSPGLSFRQAVEKLSEDPGVTIKRAVETISVSAITIEATDKTRRTVGKKLDGWYLGNEMDEKILQICEQLDVLEAAQKNPVAAEEKPVSGKRPSGFKL